MLVCLCACTLAWKTTPDANVWPCVQLYFLKNRYFMSVIVHLRWSSNQKGPSVFSGVIHHLTTSPSLSLLMNALSFPLIVIPSLWALLSSLLWLGLLPWCHFHFTMCIFPVSPLPPLPSLTSSCSCCHLTLWPMMNHSIKPSTFTRPLAPSLSISFIFHLYHL